MCKYCFFLRVVSKYCRPVCRRTQFSCRSVSSIRTEKWWRSWRLALCGNGLWVLRAARPGWSVFRVLQETAGAPAVISRPGRVATAGGARWRRVSATAWWIWTTNRWALTKKWNKLNMQRFCLTFIRQRFSSTWYVYLNLLWVMDYKTLIEIPTRRCYTYEQWRLHSSCCCF